MSSAITPFIPCADCCECPTPTIEWDSRSASKTKCGFDAGVVVCGPANKIYLVLTTSGFCTTSPDPSDFFCNDTQNSYSASSYFSGTASYDPATCEFTNDAINVPCTEPGSSAVALSELSDEYTTGELIASVLAALPAWDNDWNDTAGSYYDLTSDELTNSIRESRYRFRFKIPKVGSGTCYMITWLEVFTPEEGDPAETEMCAIWDGNIPEDYDPDDPSTYPIIGDGANPYFEVPIPATNGTTTVDPDSIVAVCRGCAGGCP